MAAGAENAYRYDWAEATDAPALGQVMYAAIHSDPSPYSAAQRQAWLATPPDGPGWQAKLTAQHVAVARSGKVPIGMMTLDDTGYLDLAFIHPDFQGQGHLRHLWAMISEKARSLGCRDITGHASLSAQAPFTALGFKLIRHEEVEKDGQFLKRAEMRFML